MKTLLTNSEILREFKKQLNSAERVDLASAWATEGPALEALAARRTSVRALVGLKHGITTPGALRCLNEIGCLRVVLGSRLFHAKVYLFHRARAGVAWVGSANFTGKGFGTDDGRNEEVMFQTRAIRGVADWFNQRWDEAGPLDEDALDEYCRCYKPPQGGEMDERLPDVADALKPPWLVTISAWEAAHQGDSLPPSAYIPAVLQALHDVGSRATRQQALGLVHETMAPVLHDIDEMDNSRGEGDSRKVWENRLEQAVYRLRIDGLIEPVPQSGRGVWALTAEGTKAASVNDWGARWRRWQGRGLATHQDS